MAGETIPLTLRAEIGDLRKELGKIPGITEGEAKKMAFALEKGFKKATKASKQAAKASSKAQSLAAKESAQAWKDFAAAAAGAALGAAAALGQMAKATADQRNAISDMAARTGVATSTLEGLRLAAEGSGREFADMDSVLNPLVARLGQVQAGSSTAEDQFKKFGVSLRDSSGDLVSNDDALKLVIDRIQDIPDAGKKAGTALGLLGEGGGKLIQVLGDVPIEAFVDQAERFGVGVGPEATESAAGFQRAIADLSLVTAGATASFGDWFALTDKIDNFNLGLVYMIALGKEGVENLTSMGSLIGAVLSGDVDSFAEASDKLRETGTSSWEDINESAMDAAFQFHENRAAIRSVNDASNDGAAAAVALSTATDGSAAASKRQAAAVRDAAAALKERTEAATSEMDAINELSDIIQTANDDTLSGLDQITAARNEDLAKIEELATAGVMAEQAAKDAMIAVNERFYRDRYDLAVEAAADQSEATREIREEEKALEAEDNQLKLDNIATMKDAAIDAAAMIAQATIDGLSKQRAAWISEQESRIDSMIAELEMKETLTKGEANMLAKLGEDKKRLGLMEFRRNKAAAVAGVILSTAQAVLKAAAVAPPPLNVVPIAAMVGLGAVQAGIVAAQKPPSYHIGKSPDEISATLTRKESVLNPRASSAMGVAAIAQLNQTGTMGGSSPTIMIGNRVVSDYIMTESQGDGELGRMMRRPSPSVRSLFK